MGIIVLKMSCSGARRDNDQQDQDDKPEELAEVKDEEESRFHNTSSFEATTS